MLIFIIMATVLGWSALTLINIIEHNRNKSDLQMAIDFSNSINQNKGDDTND